MGSSCTICGYSRCLSALEFHHIDEEEKEFSISNGFWKGIATADIVNEIKKCILVCANCHREIHAGVFDNIELQSLFSEKRFNEIFQKRCLECGISIFHLSHTFCSTRCRLTNARNKQLKTRIYNSVWHKVDVVNLLSRHNGVMVRAAKEMGISDNAVKKRFKKITSCNNWEEHLESLPKIVRK